MLKNAMHAVVVGLASTAMALLVTGVATSASPAFASSPFTPPAVMSVL